MVGKYGLEPYRRVANAVLILLSYNPVVENVARIEPAHKGL